MRYKYYLSLYDLERIEQGENVEMINKQGDIIVLELAKDEEEE